jgi:hypothetical protein
MIDFKHKDAEKIIKEAGALLAFKVEDEQLQIILLEGSCEEASESAALCGAMYVAFHESMAEEGSIH